MTKDLEIGVAPIPGPDGGESTFVGGDVIGVSSTCKHPREAWDFLQWTLSDDTQVEVVAKNKDVVVAHRPGRQQVLASRIRGS